MNEYSFLRADLLTAMHVSSCLQTGSSTLGSHLLSVNDRVTEHAHG